MKKWRDTIWLLVTAMKKLLEPNDLQLFRCAMVVARDIGTRCQEGKQFVRPAFSSTTTTIKSMSDFLGKSGPRVMWILKMSAGYVGRGFGAFSFYPGEHEVLLAPGMEFKVVSVLDLGNGLVQVQAEQIESLYAIFARFPIYNLWLGASGCQRHVANSGVDCCQSIEKC